MKKILRTVFIIAVIILNLITNVSYADDDVAETIYDVLEHGFLGTYLQSDTHMPIDIEIGTTDKINETTEFTQKLLGYLQVVGTVISIIALIVIGFRYMFSSLEEKAKMQGVLIYYIVGAILVFATSNVLSIGYNIINSL